MKVDSVSQGKRHDERLRTHPHTPEGWPGGRRGRAWTSATAGTHASWSRACGQGVAGESTQWTGPHYPPTGRVVCALLIREVALDWKGMAIITSTYSREQKKRVLPWTLYPASRV